MRKIHEFEVIRNHDYTITIRDSKKRDIVFRDITGQDLEYLDLILDNEGQEINDEQKRISFEDIQHILDLLSVKNINFGLLTHGTIIGIFNCIKEHILCNYIPKYSWLKACYGIQNGSFVNVLEMEKVPMTKFIAMTQIHKDAMDAIKND